MQAIEYVIKYSRPDEIPLYLIGDIHLGTIHCAEDEIKKKVAEIASNENAIWIGMGDMMECITSSDKRWDPTLEAIPEWLKQDNIAECLRRKTVELFSPIKDKCVGLLFGNHEHSFRIKQNDNIHQNICDDLKVKNLGYNCFVHFIFRRKSSSEAHLVKGFFTHGTGGARTEGAKINYLVRVMQSFNATIYGYAHTHSMQLYSPQMLETNDVMKVKASGKIGALTGCWFRTYTQGNVTSYGEIKVYPPSRIGCPVFVLCPDKGTIEGRTPAIDV